MEKGQIYIYQKLSADEKEVFDDGWVLDTKSLPLKEENMNKYEILEGKLTAINAYIDTMCLESNATMEYLKQYKEYVNELIIAIQNRTIRNSNGAVKGLLRGVSDYDELCADE